MRGVFLCIVYQFRNKPTDLLLAQELSFTITTKREALKSLGQNEGRLGGLSNPTSQIETTAQTPKKCPAQRQALLHPFAAGQKDVVWRDETRRF